MEFSVNKYGNNAFRGKKLKILVLDEDDWLKSVDEERNLGVLISKNLQFSKQYLTAKNNINLMLVIINRRVLYKSIEVI